MSFDPREKPDKRASVHLNAVQLNLAHLPLNLPPRIKIPEACTFFCAIFSKGLTLKSEKLFWETRNNRKPFPPSIIIGKQRHIPGKKGEGEGNGFNMK